MAYVRIWRFGALTPVEKAIAIGLEMTKATGRPRRGMANALAVLRRDPRLRACIQVHPKYGLVTGDGAALRPWTACDTLGLRRYIEANYGFPVSQPAINAALRAARHGGFEPPAPKHFKWVPR